MRYLKNVGPLSYYEINNVLGALEGAKLEFYRRVAVSYENDKILANKPDPYEEFPHGY